MSRKRRDSYLMLGGALALIAGTVVATRSRRLHTPAAVSAAVSASVAPSASAAPERPLPIRNFLFDCAAFAPSLASPCAASSGPERALLDWVNTYRVSALPCSDWSAGTFADAVSALNAALALEAQQLAPLDRALLQNAALELLACSPKPATTDKPTALASSARALIRKFVLSPEELATLPKSAELLQPWLGDSATWFTGTDPRFFHTAADGFARAHRQVLHESTAGDIVRLVLVDKANTPYVSDVVQRVVLRRLDADGIHTCFAELAPPADHCDAAGLHGLAPERGQRVLDGTGTPPCNGCHTGNVPKATPYGPGTGFELAAQSSVKITAALKALLR